ncbi:MAG: hypothetical protein IPK60_02360 [Sandaracinaceae bacterium]|nr:hypothetical protein [Sandaracinaceae bacterium]
MEINVPVSEADKVRIAKEEASWGGKKLIIFGAIFLGFCVLTLYVLANLTLWMGVHQP